VVYEVYVWSFKGEHFYDSDSVKSVKKQMEMAGSYREWKRLALALDSLQDGDKWKDTNDSTEFDHRKVQQRISLFSVNGLRHP
jgi:hypothetical protein